MCIRKILLVLIIQVMGSAGIQASSSWADGLFDELSKDFGIVSRGVTLVHKFRLKMILVNRLVSPVCAYPVVALVRRP